MTFTLKQRLDFWVESSTESARMSDSRSQAAAIDNDTVTQDYYQNKAKAIRAAIKDIQYILDKVYTVVNMRNQIRVWALVNARDSTADYQKEIIQEVTAIVGSKK